MSGATKSSRLEKPDGSGDEKCPSESDCISYNRNTKSKSKQRSVNFQSQSLVPAGHFLRFQFILKSYGDLHRLISAQLIKARVVPPQHLTAPLQDLTKIYPRTRPCILLTRPMLKPLPDKNFQIPTKPIVLSRRIMDYLFHIYTGECFHEFQHPDPAAFLETYYRGELEPALLYTAVAYSATHILLTHTKTPILKQMHVVVGELIAQAEAILEEVFDTLSPQTVLAFLNMESCMLLLSRNEEAYTYHSQALLIAMALKMDSANSNELDAVQEEFRRRVWCFLCKREIMQVYAYKRPFLIERKILYHSPKPTILPSDNKPYKIHLIQFMREIEFFASLSAFREIEWSFSDIDIAHNVIRVAALLQHTMISIAQYNSGENSKVDLVESELEISFWIYWCYLWRPFIDPDAPPGRMETDLMQQLRAKAFEQFTKGARNTAILMKSIIRDEDWCHLFPQVHTHHLCQIYKLIGCTHPDAKVRHESFQQLSQIQRIFLMLPSGKRIAGRWLANEVEATLEQMKPFVYTEEEIRTKNASKLKPLVLKKFSKAVNAYRVTSGNVELNHPSEDIRFAHRFRRPDPETVQFAHNVVQFRSSVSRATHLKRKGELSEVAALLIKLENTTEYTIKYVLENGKLQNIFWARNLNISLADKCPEIVIADSTYRTDHFNHPCLVLVGVDENLDGNCATKSRIYPCIYVGALAAYILFEKRIDRVYE
ncbi:uncharacterized protein VTP21DRAFT_6799 [Calcarisporiella thermophila]|uniref:uncharacterized protein n=1 Tax=Calcarisporiella thermophila TaxID=911321 RepID=UPI003743DFB3